MEQPTPQMAHIEDTIPPLDEVGIKRIQAIVGAVLFYGRAVDNKLLVTLNSIGTQQAAATEATNEAVNQMLDYLATYPNDGIVYRSSNMILAAHSNASSHNDPRDAVDQGPVFSLRRRPDPMVEWTYIFNRPSYQVCHNICRRG